MHSPLRPCPLPPQAPEVLRCESYTLSDSAAMMASDAYAFGCVMWEVSLKVGIARGDVELAGAAPACGARQTPLSLP